LLAQADETHEENRNSHSLIITIPTNQERSGLPCNALGRTRRPSRGTQRPVGGLAGSSQLKQREGGGRLRLAKLTNTEIVSMSVAGP
jgi:hypothetical protein